MYKPVPSPNPSKDDYQTHIEVGHMFNTAHSKFESISLTNVGLKGQPAQSAQGHNLWVNINQLLIKTKIQHPFWSNLTRIQLTLISVVTLIRIT